MLKLIELPHAGEGQLFMTAEALSQAIITTTKNHEAPHLHDLVFLSFPATDAFWRLDCTLDQVLNIIKGA